LARAPLRAQEVSFCVKKKLTKLLCQNTHKNLLIFCYARPVGLRNVLPQDFVRFSVILVPMSKQTLYTGIAVVVALAVAYLFFAYGAATPTAQG
jgi:hypothetical protein